MFVCLSLTAFVSIQYVTSIKLDQVPDGMYATPHGLRPQQCVHQVKDNNHIIHHMSDGVLIEYPGLGTSEFYPELPECVQNMKQLQSSVKYLFSANVNDDSKICYIYNNK